jgi:hypothetical protein
MAVGRLTDRGGSAREELSCCVQFGVYFNSHSELPLRQTGVVTLEGAGRRFRCISFILLLLFCRILQGLAERSAIVCTCRTIRLDCPQRCVWGA